LLSGLNPLAAIVVAGKSAAGGSADLALDKTGPVSALGGSAREQESRRHRKGDAVSHSVAVARATGPLAIDRGRAEVISASVATAQSVGHVSTGAKPRGDEPAVAVGAFAKVPIAVPAAIEDTWASIAMASVCRFAKAANGGSSAMASVSQSAEAGMSSASQAAATSTMAAMTADGGSDSAVMSPGQTTRQAAEGQQRGESEQVWAHARLSNLATFERRRTTGVVGEGAAYESTDAKCRQWPGTPRIAQL
jgi:hypothetical protein